MGIALLWDKEGVYGAGLALGENEMYYVPVEGMVTAAYLSDKIGRLGKSTTVCSMDVKTMLKRADLTPDANVFDCSIAAYLLNPLKSTYTYEELAKDYLDGKLLPGKEELTGKNIPEKGLGGGYARTGTSGMLYGVYRFCHQSPPESEASGNRYVEGIYRD